jgi:hypothetical protein
MECQAHHDEDRRTPAGYPASMLSEMRGGGRDQGRLLVKLSREAAIVLHDDRYVHYFALL